MFMFSCSVGERNRWCHFHAQVMAVDTVNNKENLNSQSSQLEEEDLQKLEAKSVPVNTKKPHVVAP